MTTLFKVNCNSGAHTVRFIKNYNSKKNIELGDIILTSVQKVYINSKIRRGEMYKALVVSLRKKTSNKKGLEIQASSNSVILLNQSFEPISDKISFCLNMVKNDKLNLGNKTLKTLTKKYI